MAQTIAYLEAYVGADVQDFRRGMQQVRRETSLLSDTLGGIGAIGRGMTFAITLPILAAGAASVKMASDFDASMRNINSIAQLSEDQFGALKQRVLDFGTGTRSGAQAAADALYEVYSAGLEGEKAFDLMQQATMLAESGLSDLSATTNALTATMLVYSDTTMTSADASNIWARMVQLGVGSLSDFLANSQKVLPLAHTLGISFQDLGGNLAYLSQTGGGAEKAETAVAMMMSNLLKPTKALSTEFSKLGVKTGIELITKFGSLEGAVKALRDDMSDTDFFKSFSKTGLEAALGLTNNYDKLTATISKFNTNLDTATSSAWAQQMLSFSASIDKLKSSVSGAAIAIGSVLLPVLQPMVDKIAGFFRGVEQLNPQLLQLIVVVGGVIAAAGPLLWLIGSLITPVGLLIGLVAGLATAFATNFGGIRDSLSKIVSDILGNLKPLTDALSRFWAILTGEEGVKTNTAQIGTKFLGDMAKSGFDMGIALVENITKATSAWDLYTSSGLDKKMSWSAFQDELKKQGWTGGALLEGQTFKFFSDEQINSAFSNLSQVVAPGGAKILAGVTESKAGGSTFGERLASAFSNAWPAIQTALGGVWDNIKTWVTTTGLPALDKAGGSILATIAGWFNPVKSAGMFPGAGGLTATLESALGGGPNSIPGQVAATGQNLTKTFPAISNGLSTLFGNIGAWIQTDGLPTIARSIGYLAGSIAALIGSALGSIWTSITQGGPTGGETNKKDAGDKFNDMVLHPMSEGVQDALTQHGITNPIDAFFTNLGAALEIGAAAWIIAPSVVKAIATKLFTAVKGAITTEAAAPAVAEVGTALTGAMALIPITLGIVVGAFIFKLLPDATKQGIHDLFASILTGKNGADFDKTIQDQGYQLMAGLFELAGKITNDPALLAKAETLAKWGGVSLTVDNVTLTPGAGATITFDQAAFERRIGALMPGAVKSTMGASGNSPFDYNTAIAMPVNFGATIDVPTVDSDVAAQITPDSFTATSAALQTATTTAMQTGMSGTDVADTIVKPIAEAFTTNFGEGAPATVAWATFTDNIKTGGADVTNTMLDIDINLLALKADMIKNAPLTAAPIVTMFSGIQVAANNALLAIVAVVDALNNLNGKTITITSATAAVPATMPGHASGGTASGWSMVGERGPEAAYFGNAGTVMPTHSLRDMMQGGGGGGDTVIVQVYGIQSIDDMLSELNRRGYNVEKIRK